MQLLFSAYQFFQAQDILGNTDELYNAALKTWYVGKELNI